MISTAARRSIAVIASVILVATGTTLPAAAAGPPAGDYSGPTVQTHIHSRPDETPTTRSLTFTIDTQGRIGNLAARYFWWCAEYYETTDIDTPMPATRITAGEPFSIKWEDVASKWTFSGVIHADGTGSGIFDAAMGVCGTSRLTWEATRSGSTTPPPTTNPAPPGFTRTAPYTLEGNHTVNGRQWRTVCSPYSRTERCRTEILATTVTRSGNQYTRTTGWTFNNLTYLPFMTRAQWAGNPLAANGSFTAADGRRWRTECDTPATGRNGCRSYVQATVFVATPRSGGGYTFSQKTDWVFNNIVQFR